MVFVICFYWGFTVIIRYTVLFVWTAELFPEKHSTHISTSLTATIGVSYFLINGYWMFLSKSFVPLFTASAIVHAAVFLAVLAIPESPTWLLSSG